MGLGTAGAAVVSAAELRRVGRLALALAPPWAVAAFLASRLSGMTVGTDDPLIVVVGSPLAAALVRAASTGFVIGILAAWIETRHLAPMSRRLPLAASLALRTVLYAVVVGLTFLAQLALASLLLGMTPAELVQLPQFQSIVGGPSFWTFLTLLLLASFGINFGMQLRRVLGPETLKALFLGTYRRPTREQRAFVFLDLTDSTAIAERLGPLAFTEFKNDFFADVAEPVLATGGRIVQYVGDEVMVAWTMAHAERDAAPIRFVWLVEDRIAAHAATYQSRHGVVPAFKAGVHGGEVVTAEVGDLKRDIVHSGDVVNTAARIEGECRPRGERLLVSAELLARMPLPGSVVCHAEPIGALPLRGKAEPVGVVAVRRGEANATASGLEPAAS